MLESNAQAGWSLRSFFFFFFLGCSFLVSSPAHADSFNATHSTAFLHPTEDEVAHRKHLHAPGVRFGLVQDPAIILDYHFGPLMSGTRDVIKVRLIYYGHFSIKQKNIIRMFFNSFSHTDPNLPKTKPTVHKWWKITQRYVDLYNTRVARLIVPAGEVSYKYTMGKNLKQSDLQKLVIRSMKTFGIDARSIYLVLTSQDVLVERFCMNVCGTHFYTFPIDATRSQMVPYGWVGNPAKQCPELCTWPYAAGGFLTQGLIPPNGDAGIDGMIITIGNLLAAIGTNPYGNGFFQGDGLESAGVCQGTYGKHSFPGYPGELLVDQATGASFNMYGYNSAKFLVPWIWNPLNQQCSGQA